AFEIASSHAGKFSEASFSTRTRLPARRGAPAAREKACSAMMRSGVAGARLWTAEVTSRSTRLHQHDIELFLVVRALDLERHRFADEVGEHGEALRFLVEEHVDDVLGREDAVFARIELPRFAQQLAQDLVAHGLRRLELAAAFAHRARLAQH